MRGLRTSSVLVVLAIAVTSGCTHAGAPHRPSVAPKPRLVVHPATATVAAAKAAARRAADRLQALAPVPRGAQPVETLPKRLSEAAMKPTATSIADMWRGWRIPLSFTDTVRWVKAHQPRGLTLSGQGTSSGRRPEQRGADFSFDAPDEPGVTDEQLVVSIAPRDATSTWLRVDGLAVWLDPRPFVDAGVGPRLRVTIASGCPASDRRMVGVRNTGADLRHALLPSAAPTGGLVCRYSGSNGDPPSGLRVPNRLDVRRAVTVAHAVQSLPFGHPTGGWMSCPASDGSLTVVALTYPGRAEVDVWMSGSGSCGSVANGFIAAWPRDVVDVVDQVAGS